MCKLKTQASNEEQNITGIIGPKYLQRCWKFGNVGMQHQIIYGKTQSFTGKSISMKMDNITGIMDRKNIRWFGQSRRSSCQNSEKVNHSLLLKKFELRTLPTASWGIELYRSSCSIHVGIAIINHPPFITILLGGSGIPTIKNRWVYYYRCTNITMVNSGDTCLYMVIYAEYTVVISPDMITRG